jgi:hypothetical protein
LILDSVRTAGFDRVRAFRFDDASRAFVGIDAIGTGREQVKDYSISIASSPYAEYKVALATASPAAHVIDPKAMADPITGKTYGPDPHAQKLGKPIDLPWAVVTLVSGGKLYGYLAADNADTKREITKESLDYLTVVGALAGQAVAYSNELEGARRSRIREEMFVQKVPKVASEIRSKTHDFDVFLSYNNKDWQKADEVAKLLREHGIAPWLDRDEIKGGDWWQNVLSAQIRRIKVVAVLLSHGRLGPWQNVEVQRFIEEAVKQRRRVIPVILKGARLRRPPGLLSAFHAVDFREITPDPISELVRGIEGNRKLP